jgi:ribonuclease HI
MASRLKVYFDGGCRPNPGAMELAVVAAGQTWLERDAGPGTSTDAEWLALLYALRIAQALGATDFVLLGDAAAVIGAATGAVRCRGAGLRHMAELHRLVGAGNLPRIRYIRRSQNLAGIALARLHPR